MPTFADKIVHDIDREQFDHLFHIRFPNLGVRPFPAHLAERTIKAVFEHGHPSMNAHEYAVAWLAMRNASRPYGYFRMTASIVDLSLNTMAEAIAAGLVCVEGRGPTTRFMLVKPGPSYERGDGGSRFVLPHGPRKTRHDRHTAHVEPMLIERLTRIADHPAARTPMIPDAWIAGCNVSPGVLKDRLPELLTTHRHMRDTSQTHWLNAVTNTLWRLDYRVPEAETPQEDMEALGELV